MLFMVKEFKLYDVKVVLNKQNKKNKIKETFREQVEGKNVDKVKSEAKKYYDKNELVDIIVDSCWD